MVGGTRAGRPTSATRPGRCWATPPPGDEAADAAEAYQQRNPDAAGNGALMRTGPVALAHLGDRDAVAGLAASVASLTHPHPDSVDACVLWSLAIERAIMTATADDEFDWRAALLDGLEHLEPDRRETWRTRIDEAHGRDPSEYTNNNGWVVAAFQAAFAAITRPRSRRHPRPCGHLADALRLASRSGGDTDTVAAIAGSLLGARWGGTAVPLSWRRRLHGRRTYDEPALRAGDLDAMARLAVDGGHPDSHRLARCRDAGAVLHRQLRLRTAGAGDRRRLVRQRRRRCPKHSTRGRRPWCRCAGWAPPTCPPASSTSRSALIDTTAEDNSNLAFVLADTARTIVELVDEGERVFVHCVAAENRTPAVAAAYLMARGVESEAAIERAAGEFGRRPQAFLVDGLTAIAGVS